MKYKDTKCKFCGTKEGRLFIIPKPESKEDYWCEDCKNKEMGVAKNG